MFPDFEKALKKFDDGLKAVVRAIDDLLVETSNTNDKLDQIIELMEKERDKNN